MSHTLATFRAVDELDRIAESQHAVLTRAQATGLGISDATVEYRLRVGRWERLSEGVYRVTGSQRTGSRR
jgi:hypothetical protein